MDDFIASLDLNQYLPAALDWATNVLLAIAILIIGYWIAGRIGPLAALLAGRDVGLDIGATVREKTFLGVNVYAYGIYVEPYGAQAALKEKWGETETKKLKKSEEPIKHESRGGAVAGRPHERGDHAVAEAHVGGGRRRAR